MTSLNKKQIKKSLRESKDDYDFDGEFCSINGVKSEPNRVTVKHLLVQRNKRGNGYGSKMFESLLEVLREDEVELLTVEVQAMEDGGPEDPVMEFLSSYGMKYKKTFEHHNWDTCVRATGRTF